MYTGGDLKFNWECGMYLLAWFGKALNMLAISQELNRNPHYEIRGDVCSLHSHTRPRRGHYGRF